MEHIWRIELTARKDSTNFKVARSTSSQYIEGEFFSQPEETTLSLWDLAVDATSTDRLYLRYGQFLLVALEDNDFALIAVPLDGGWFFAVSNHRREINYELVENNSLVYTLYGDSAISGLTEGGERLKHLIVPEGITQLYDSAFVDANELVSVSLPSSLVVIGQSVFEGLPNLTRVSFPRSSSLSAIQSYAFFQDHKLTTFSVPAFVNSIAQFAFAASGLVSLSFLGENIRQIRASAFADCKFSKLDLAANDATLGKRAFADNTQLTTVNLSGVTSIEDGCFSGCASLQKVYLPYSLTSLGAAVFSYCLILDSIEFEGSMARWKVITRDSDWDKDSAVRFVNCSDGVYKL